MQKVSKQSLAMIALSILLAISIALTFTFALTGVSNTATGTITFTGNASILIDGTAADYTFDVKFDANGDGTAYEKGTTKKLELSELRVTLGSGSTSTKVKATMQFTEPNDAVGLLKKYINMGSTTTLDKTTNEKITANGLAFTMKDVLIFARIENTSADFATLTSTDGPYGVKITFETVD